MFDVWNGKSMKFWTDIWNKNTSLVTSYTGIYERIARKEIGSQMDGPVENEVRILFSKDSRQGHSRQQIGSRA